ncbi:toxin-antitoxin system YwqK family antitoxin [Pandoraea bronchicola]|uniref:MORN repeat-containing protein n=1 Tax=Pandoraea bronchicola TaxID=2508287 RepID=A0A5E5BW78_9BURK|nr:hypothetical protein [Pandoraea bronchicola]VVE89874.1 hypothetical protein PBR20603_03847 [Pandoraea bronchicola]
MKQTNRTLLARISVLSLLALAACAGQELDFRNALIVNGKVYAEGANKPFSGKLTNVPNGAILDNLASFAKFSNAIRTTLPQLAVNPARAASLAYFYNGARETVGVYCDAEVSDGLLDGPATCSTANSGNMLITMKFSSGKLDGKLTSYAPGGNKQIISEVAFVDGQPDGTQEIFSPSTKKRIHVIHWDKGVLTGAEEGFDENTGSRILEATYVNGQLDGPLTRYAPSGDQVIMKATFAGGKQVGTQEGFDPQTGRLISRAEFVDGKVQGIARRWDNSGKLVFENEYRDGQVMPDSEPVNDCLARKLSVYERTSSTSWTPDQREMWHAECRHASISVANIPADQPSQPNGGKPNCVDSWTAAFRKENGDDAIVTVDQLGEWKIWCEQGKLPH